MQSKANECNTNDLLEGLSSKHLGSPLQRARNTYGTALRDGEESGLESGETERLDDDRVLLGGSVLEIAARRCDQRENRKRLRRLESLRDGSPESEEPRLGIVNSLHESMKVVLLALSKYGHKNTLTDTSSRP
jgi:hypothetical protein